MKYIKQFLIIIAVTFLGELCRYLLPLPIPAGIYGMLFLFAALMLKIIRVSDIADTAHFLIDIMPIMFIPAGVGLLASWDAVKDMWLALIVIVLVSTVLVMGLTGRVTQRVMRGKENKQ